MIDWLEISGYVFDEDRDCWAIAWSMRVGYDYTDLEFRSSGTGRYANSLDAIIGHHASGSNPRMILGQCDTLEDVIRTHEAVRLINGYPKPELGKN